VQQGKTGSFGHDMLVNCQQMATSQGKFRQKLAQFPCFDLKNINYKSSGINKMLCQIIMEITVRIPKETQTKTNERKNSKTKKENGKMKTTMVKEQMKVRN
jgi:hypothetical protein